MFKTSRRQSRFIALAAVLFLFASPLCAAPQAPAAVEAKAAARVARVLDGDSLRLADGTEVRLIGVDSPEFSDQDRNVQNARRLGLDPAAYAGFAVKARRRAQELTANADIRLEFDASNAATAHKDKYGRLLAYVWAGDVFVNAELIREGYATAYGRFPHARRAEFYALQKSAKSKQSGFWAHRLKTSS